MSEPKRRGRPVGSCKPEGTHAEDHKISFIPADWLYCLKQPGGASQFIRALIAQHKGEVSNESSI